MLVKCVLSFAVVCAYITAVASCPQGCECKVSTMTCQGVNQNTVFYTSTLITAVTFQDSLVNVEKVIKAYEHLEMLEFLNSVAINCPCGSTQLVITGACQTAGNDDTPVNHNLMDKDNKYAEFVKGMIDSLNSLNTHTTEYENTKIQQVKMVDEEEYDLLVRRIIDTLNHIKTDNWCGIILTSLGYGIVVIYWIIYIVKKIKEKREQRHIRAFQMAQGFERRGPRTRSQTRARARSQTAEA